MKTQHVMKNISESQYKTMHAIMKLRNSLHFSLINSQNSGLMKYLQHWL